MKTLALPIQTIAISDELGVMTPMRFKAMTKDDNVIVINIDKVIEQTMENLTGNNMILYKCTGFIKDKQKEFELKYELNTCKWMLWRM